MQTVNFAIIGCGRIFSKHASAISDLENAKLVAVCDVVEEKAKKMAEEYKCDYFTDYKEMLKQPAIDVVSVCTPSGFHCEMTLNSARSKKHVVTEKPMAMNMKEAREMVKVCKEEGVKLFVVKQNRYNTPIKEMKKALDEGRFGKLFLGNIKVHWTRPQEYYDQDEWRGTRARDGGVLMNQASHHVDMLRWMMGEPQSIVGFCSTMTHDIESEDTAVAIVKFKNGAFATIETTTSIFPKNIEGSISVFGDAGSAKVGGTAMNKIDVWEFKDNKETKETMEKFSTNPPNVYGFGHQEYFKDVVKSILEDLDPVVDGNEGLKSLELIEGIYTSIEMGGKEINLPLK
jgi:UDP-N-acetyl-2-amino-2-deoxyglucuronate dehydrogenase